jgi:hypothetical protein
VAREDDGDVVVYGGGPLLACAVVELDRRGIAPTDVSVGRTTLEDVFIAMTGKKIRA